MDHLKNKRNRPKVPLSSRKRAMQACTPCRLRKSKCRFSSAFACQRCINNSQRCFFEPAKSDALEDDTFMSGDEANDALICDVLKSFNKRYPSVSLKRRHVASLIRLLSQDRQQSVLRGFDSAMPSQIGTAPSSDYFAVETRHPLPPDAKLVDCSDKSGELANEGFLALAAQVVSQAKVDNSLTGIASMGDAIHLFDDICSVESSAILPSIWSQFPSRTEADILMNIFFSIVQTNYYILPEQWFRSRVSEIYDTNLSAEVEFQFTGLALMTFAVASQNVKNRSSGGNSIPGTVYFQSARRLLPQMLAEPSLESLQCCLLMAIYLLPFRGARSSYIYSRLAMQMAISQGLHQADGGSKPPPAAQEVYHRVFWTAYIIERRIAGDLGYRPLIPVSEIKCPPPQRYAGLDEAKLCQIDRLIAYRELLLLFEQAMQPRRCGSNSADIRSNCSRLRNWKKSLHSNLQRLDDWSLRANSHLQIHYHLCWIYLGRVDLIQIVENYLNNHITGFDIEDHDNSLSVALSISCVDSAYKIIDIIDLLHQQNQLEKFSYTDFHSCSLATTIILLDSIVYPSSEAGSKVSTGMQALRFIASENSKALKRLKYIEGLLQEINGVLGHIHRRTTRRIPVGCSSDEKFSIGS